MRVFGFIAAAALAGCQGTVAGITGTTTGTGGCDRLQEELEDLFDELLFAHGALLACTEQTDDPSACDDDFDYWIQLTVRHAEAYADWSECKGGLGL